MGAISGTSGRLGPSGCCDFRERKDLNPLSQSFLGGVSNGLIGILSLDTPTHTGTYWIGWHLLDTNQQVVFNDVTGTRFSLWGVSQDGQHVFQGQQGTDTYYYGGRWYKDM